MHKSNPTQSASDGLDRVTALLNGKQPLEAANAYEEWAYQFEHRIVDIGGEAHLKYTVRQRGGRRSRRRR